MVSVYCEYWTKTLWDLPFLPDVIAKEKCESEFNRVLKTMSTVLDAAEYFIYAKYHTLATKYSLDECLSLIFVGFLGNAAIKLQRYEWCSAAGCEVLWAWISAFSKREFHSCLPKCFNSPRLVFVGKLNYHRIRNVQEILEYFSFSFSFLEE